MAKFTEEEKRIIQWMYKITSSMAEENLANANAEDEICEWNEYTPMDKCFHRYYLGCGEAFVQFHNKTSYKYCPYCGKKIKAVE